MLKRICLDCQKPYPSKPGSSRCAQCQEPITKAIEAKRKPRDKTHYSDKAYRVNRAIMLSDPLARCAVCQTDKDLTVDHRTPVSQGGRHDLFNLMVLCRKHNSQKAGRSLKQYAAYLSGAELPNVPKA